MKSKIVFWAIVSALAGFLFGFDTVVISGAEKTIQALWGLTPSAHGLAMGAALYGTTLGAIFGGIPSDRFGRRKTLICIGALYFISAVWSGLATGVWTFIIARFIGGLGVGISTVAAPLYISEIAPPKHRGVLTGLFQFNIVFGIIVAYLSNYLLGGIGETAWRWMLGAEAFPALLYWALCFAIPESPRWLILHGCKPAGVNVLRMLQPAAREAEVQALAGEIEASGQGMKAGRAESILSRRFRVPLLLAFAVAFFNQLSGINAVLYFAPRIFEMTGLGPKAALLQSVGIGVTNLLFTFAGLALIDRLGRKTLLYVGSVGYIASLGLTAWAFFSGTFGIVPPCIFAFVGAHAIGQGAVIWVFISEVFPNAQRGAGQAFGCATHWVFAALITSVFPYAVARIVPNPDVTVAPAGYIFGFFCLMMLLQLLWVFFFVPETKGVPLEQMQKRLGTAE
ncbi:MAG: sugar porter family MFS transporter [Kiritimatiellaeota bacterium]|nr:sugar porter family MFS transporter [Kiritimatiellota bacterium]